MNEFPDKDDGSIPTPLTDAARFVQYDEFVFSGRELVSAGFARQLERRLHVAVEALRWNVEHAHSCVVEDFGVASNMADHAAEALRRIEEMK